MPANIDTMAYVGAVPWHGLGTAVPAGANVDQMLKASGLTWEPIIVPLVYTHNGKPHTAPERAMLRNDTGRRLDTVGPDYVPIQNAEVLEFFRSYANAGEMALETLGALEDGRWVWALAKMNRSFALGTDRVEGYVLLANPHLYARSATAKFTGVRVVCSNTLLMALGDHGEQVKITHIREFNEERRTEVQTQLGIARVQMDTLQADAEVLAATHLTDRRAQTLLNRVFSKTADDKPDRATGWEDAPRAVKRAFDLYKGKAKGADLPSAKDTAWGLLNAVTQYVDWERSRTPDRRLQRAWFGSGARLKAKALATLKTATQKKGA